MAEQRNESQQRNEYVPPDYTQIDCANPQALRFWAKTLETPEERLRQVVDKVGPLVEDVKRELGIAGAG